MAVVLQAGGWTGQSPEIPSIQYFHDSIAFHFRSLSQLQTLMTRNSFHYVSVHLLSRKPAENLPSTEGNAQHSCGNKSKSKICALSLVVPWMIQTQKPKSKKQLKKTRTEKRCPQRNTPLWKKNNQYLDICFNKDLRCCKYAITFLLMHHFCIFLNIFENIIILVVQLL